MLFQVQPEKKPPDTNFACTSSPCFPPASDSEWPHHLAQTTVGANITLSLNASTCFGLSLGRHAMRAKENTDGTAPPFGKCLTFLGFKSWWWKSSQTLRYEHESENFSQGGCARRIRPCCWGRGSSISQPHKWQVTSASWAHFTVENYERRVKD